MVDVATEDVGMEEAAVMDIAAHIVDTVVEAATERITVSNT